MRRREFLGALSGATAWPLAARAQQPERPRRIGMLMGYPEHDPEMKSRLSAFRLGLEKRGWSEKGNVHIEYRFGAGNADRYRSFAKELVALQPEVILAQFVKGSSINKVVN